MKNWFYIILTKAHRLAQRLLYCSSVGVKGLVINAQQEILLVEHTYMDGWHLPGGRVDPGETPKQAIIRELEEEAGITAKLTDLILFAIYSNKILGASDYPILYIVKHFERLPDPQSSPEIKSAQWFAIDRLPQDTTGKTRNRIAEYMQQLAPNEYW